MINFEFLSNDTVREISKWDYGLGKESVEMDSYFKSCNSRKDRMSGPDECEGFVGKLGGENFGLIEYYFRDNIMEIGVAINPQYKGKGFGGLLLMEGIVYGIKKYKYIEKYIKVAVSKTNKAAIRVYEQSGFIKSKNIRNEDGKITGYEMRKYL